MRRREVILALGAAAVWPLLAHGQQVNKIPRVGVLWHAGNEEEEALELAALRQGFRDLGYIEGKDFALENRFAAERYERFTNLAAGLVEAKVDIIVAVTPPAARAAEQT